MGISICDFVMWPDEDDRRVPMLSRWHMTEQESGIRGLGQIRHVFLELPKYDASRPPRTDIEKWAYFFREAGHLSVIPEPLSEQPFIEAFEASRIAGFTIDEWDSYMLNLIAIQDQRSLEINAERRGYHFGDITGHARGKREGLAEGEAGLRKAIDLACGSFSLELDASQRLELERMDIAALSSVLVRLHAEKRWS